MTPPQGWTAAIIETMGIELWRIPIVIASAAAIYIVFHALIHVFGPRILTGATSFDAAVIIMLGAVAGRVVIGHPPTVAAGVIGLVTLVVLEIAFGSLNTALSRARARKYLPRGLNTQPVVVFAHGKLLISHARRAHVTRADLAYAMRRAGVSDPKSVQCAILEPNGTISIIHSCDAVDPNLMAGVVGAEHVLLDGPAPRT